MKVFTQITKQCSVGMLLFLLVFALGSVSCKRDIVPAQEEDPNELTLTATHPVPIENAALAPSRATIDQFAAGSAVGLFVQLRSESNQGSSVVMKSNALYRYDQPVWQPDTKADKLMYHETDPVYVFGYYPHPSMAGASTSIAEGTSVVSYVLPKDQSTEDQVNTSDLLWVGAKNEGQGFVRQRQPVNLSFQHKLCKVSFHVKLIDSKPDANSESKIYLRSLSAIGSQITANAQLNVLNGIITPTYQPTHFDSVRWESKLLNGVELTVGAPAVHVADLLLVPFVAVQSQNWFRYVVFYPNANLYQSFTAQIPVYDPGAGGGAASMLCFESNKHNKVTVTIDVSSAYMSITADIATWGVGPETELPTEPE